MIEDNFFDPENLPMPEWAVGLANGRYEALGATLETRDGRRIGNAVVVEVQHPCWETDDERDIRVLTDIGNYMSMTVADARMLFYPPRYLADVLESERTRSRLLEMQND